MEIKILYDTTDPDIVLCQSCADDPTTPGTVETILWYMVVEVKYGSEDHPGQESRGSAPAQTVPRAGMEVTRFLIFHTNHKAASSKRPDSAIAR